MEYTGAITLPEFNFLNALLAGIVILAGFGILARELTYYFWLKEMPETEHRLRQLFGDEASAVHQRLTAVAGQVALKFKLPEPMFVISNAEGFFAGLNYSLFRNVPIFILGPTMFELDEIELEGALARLFSHFKRRYSFYNLRLYFLDVFGGMDSFKDECAADAMAVSRVGAKPVLAYLERRLRQCEEESTRESAEFLCDRTAGAATKSYGELAREIKRRLRSLY